MARAAGPGGRARQGSGRQGEVGAGAERGSNTISLLKGGLAVT